jgi:photosystem II stability/assembly factor-like uncharacterized protein
MKGMYAVLIYLVFPMLMFGQHLPENPDLIKPDKAKPLIRMEEYQKQRAWPQEDIPINARANAIDRERMMKHKFANNYDKILAEQPDWVNVGPFNVGGRVKSVVVHPNDHLTVYIGAAAGGIWKTTDGGESWRSLFDYENAITMGSIAIDHNNPDILFAGTGEAVLGGGNIYTGSGMYKSTDAGESWNLIGLSKVAAFSKVYVHPLNSDLIVAGAIKNEQGFYRSTDAGNTWEKLLDKSVSDVTYNPQNESEYFIGVNSEGVYYSSDAGDTWEKRNIGIEDGNPIGRVSVQIAPSEPNILYALMEKTANEDGWIYKSTNSGNSWNLIYNDPGVIFGSNKQGFYDNFVIIHPTNPNHVYLGGIALWYTRDGGNNWYSVQERDANGGVVHVDQHAGAFAPSNPLIIYIGNDGGVYKSINNGNAWLDANTGLMITQFYAMDIDLTRAQRNYGGTQDNGTLGNPSDGNYGMIWGGDGFDVYVDPQNPNIIFGELYYGQMWRRNLSNGSGEWIDENQFYGDQGAWHTPIYQNPIFPDLMYQARSDIYVSYTRGTSWSRITNDQKEAKYSTITSNYNNPRYVLAGNSVGEVLVSDDEGSSFREVHQNGLVTRYVTDAMFSHFKEKSIYVTFSGYGNPHVFKTTDLGESWFDISQNLPDVPVNCLALHPYDEETIFVGTDIGVYASFDDGKIWLPYGKNFPKTVVTDLKFMDNNSISPDLKLRAATHGRSILEAVVPEEIITEAEITSPAGGEKLISTSNKVISWFGFNSPVKVEASYDNGETWSLVAENLAGNNLYWRVPNVESFLCRIKISTMDGSIVRISNTFTISKKRKGDLVKQSSVNHVPYGLAYDGEGGLYTTSFYENKLYRLDADDFSVTTTLPLPPGEFYTGVAIDKENKHIYVHKMKGEGGGGGFIFKLDYQGNLLEQMDSPARNYPTGLAYLNGYLYSNDRDGSQLQYQFDPNSKTVVNSYDNPYSKDLGPRGLTSTKDGTLLQVCTEFPNSGALSEALVMEIQVSQNPVPKQSMPIRSTSGLLNGRGVEYDDLTEDIWVSTFNGDIVKIAGFNTVVSVNDEIKTADTKNDVKIYPNPTSDIVNISILPDYTGEIEFELTDLLGNKIKSSKAFVNAGMPFETNFDLYTEASGVYLLTVKSNKRIILVKRLIKR